MKKLDGMSRREMLNYVASLRADARKLRREARPLTQKLGGLNRKIKQLEREVDHVEASLRDEDDNPVDMEHDAWAQAPGGYVTHIGGNLGNGCRWC